MKAVIFAVVAVLVCLALVQAQTRPIFPKNYYTRGGGSTWSTSQANFTKADYYNSGYTQSIRISGLLYAEHQGPFNFTLMELYSHTPPRQYTILEQYKQCTGRVAEGKYFDPLEEIEYASFKGKAVHDGRSVDVWALTAGTNTISYYVESNNVNVPVLVNITAGAEFLHITYSNFVASAPPQSAFDIPSFCHNQEEVTINKRNSDMLGAIVAKAASIKF
eukprot:TRINITY_DN14517_c0_g1_i1.p1 TRINITY_DN14517_c0_g1~~TRINITY_DN14517_c0_g1_i1.p1  ORF type:complete len:232 (+),score=59.53 TRINITY_DN14517_c0_g1_i1:41-697(+)